MLALRTRTLPSRWLSCRGLATAAALPQTYVEKVVQRHAVGLAEGKQVRAGDYVMIKPQHVMTHVSGGPRHSVHAKMVVLTDFRLAQDNTGPVISK